MEINRFLGARNPSSAAGDDELHEEDVFWAVDFAEPSHRNGCDLATPPPRHRGFGILAALPEEDTAPASFRKSSLSLFHHKSSISIPISISPASSSSRSVVSRPKSVPYGQSAPVSVPATARMRRRDREFDELSDGEEEGGGGEMLPPHEMVARSSGTAPALACSVLEGAGRTLKGRDLRQVRNAVFRQTAAVKFWLNQFPDRCDVRWVIGRMKE